MGFQQAKQDALWDWVTSILNTTGDPSKEIPIVWANERGPRPGVAYVQLNITTDSPEGTVQITPADVDGNVLLIGYGVMNVSLQSFGPDSNEYLEILKRSYRKDSSKTVLDTSGLVIREVGNVNGVPEILDETPEHRWVLEMTFGYAWSTTDAVGYITNVEYTGDYT
jgi:hypothetical protein